jgi:hypothetical protein
MRSSSVTTISCAAVTCAFFALRRVTSALLSSDSTVCCSCCCGCTTAATAWLNFAFVLLQLQTRISHASITAARVQGDSRYTHNSVQQQCTASVLHDSGISNFKQSVLQMLIDIIADHVFKLQPARECRGASYSTVLLTALRTLCTTAVAIGYVL